MNALRYGFVGWLCWASIGFSQTHEPAVDSITATTPIRVEHVFPQITVMAPGAGSDSEAGIGALIPWADRLWLIGYVAHIRGEGLGLYELREDMVLRKRPESVTGTFANRMVHWPSKQAFIGPYAIDEKGNVRTIEGLKNVRLTATIEHLTDPKNKVYVLGMEGPFYEVNVNTLEAVKLCDLVSELDLKDGKPHFKGAFTGQSRVVVANNTYDQREYLGQRQGGRLAEWDGKTWTIIESNPFVEVFGGGDSTTGGPVIFATGWDRASAILRTRIDGRWRKYRLPKAGQSWEHAWFTEWMRIRQAQTERFVMDLQGMFYDLPLTTYGGNVWGIRPISSHLRIVPDFCFWRGMFVMAGDQIDHDQGQPQSGLWFGDIDDLWHMGKPAGWGGPWRETAVKAHEISDPFLMTGFDKKVLHLSHDNPGDVRFVVEVDFLGDGSWKRYTELNVPAKGYVHHEFPDGFSAHWARITAERACAATAWFMYN